ncbi:hypothetical protein [Rufibacter psychrotolerans]|uniref:hypothetical protein n=1 Tax=Rufibacter psychrotolerans TaxID=2812556 RepID=UPI0019686DF7|nr:hypothetical protein [Rufibacter sp. SYSU D00308]
MSDKIEPTDNADNVQKSDQAGSETSSATNQNQGRQSERQRDSGSSNDTYKRSMTGYDSTKQDENFSGTERASGGATIDERDPNDGDANQENNY